MTIALIESLQESWREAAKKLPPESSSRIELQVSLSKLLVVAAASYHEVRITKAMEEAMNRITPALSSFVKKKTLKRQYHTWFNWDVSDAISSFMTLLSLDGKYKGDLKNKAELKKAAESFTWLGSTRNKLAHGNILASADLQDVTIEDIDAHIKSAEFVLAYIETALIP